jgi:hypothetical protein
MKIDDEQQSAQDVKERRKYRILWTVLWPVTLGVMYFTWKELAKQTQVALEAARASRDAVNASRDLAQASLLSIDTQKEIVKLETFHNLMERMESVRKDRGKVREYVRVSKKENNSKVVFPLPPEVQEAADRICREFDHLALLDSTDLVDRRLIDRSYAVPFVLLYEDVLGEYISELRKRENRGGTHFWELVAFYERVRNVPQNHPCNSQQDCWPDNARSV